MTNAVEIHGVTKTFGKHVAVDDLTLTVPSGTIYGFIGPNGSGKTTTLRMIMRILHPDASRGTIRVLGEESFEAADDRVGYLPEERGLYKKMTVRDMCAFAAELKGCSNVRGRVSEWLERMQLSAWADKKVDALSKGMSQKVQFICAVVSRPQLVLLDEPFSGLDPVNTEVLTKAVLDLRRDGTTVIFSTHDMGVAERMCDFIFMIYKGGKVLDGTLKSIQERYGRDTIRVRLDGEASALDGIGGIGRVNDFGRYQEIRLENGTDPQVVLRALAARARVQLFEIACPSLHDVFVRIAGPEAGVGDAGVPEGGHA